MGLLRALGELGVAVAIVPIKLSTKGVKMAQSIIDGEGGIMMTDAEYCRYRMSHPVKKLVRESGSEFVVETADGHREKWMKPESSNPYWAMVTA
ncbi:MAG: hypothetical protein HYU02_02440 [Thaumarchaeota archaeon]|nr:hypothetical protein [Nitrososphaerota archaeon]